MRVEELTEEECRAALGRLHVARLACACDGQPYIVPVNYGFDGEHLYGLTTAGQKIEWMRSNPRVCLEVDESRSEHEWTSVVVFGRFEEITDAEAHGELRSHALEVLQRRELWWQPASAARRLRAGWGAPLFYRIRVERLTGRRAFPNVLEAGRAP